MDHDIGQLVRDFKADNGREPTRSELREMLDELRRMGG